MSVEPFLTGVVANGVYFDVSTFPAFIFVFLGALFASDEDSRDIFSRRATSIQRPLSTQVTNEQLAVRRIFFPLYRIAIVSLIFG